MQETDSQKHEAKVYEGFEQVGKRDHSSDGRSTKTEADLAVAKYIYVHVG